MKKTKSESDLFNSEFEIEGQNQSVEAPEKDENIPAFLNTMPPDGDEDVSDDSTPPFMSDEQTVNTLGGTTESKTTKKESSKENKEPKNTDKPVTINPITVPESVEKAAIGFDTDAFQLLTDNVLDLSKKITLIENDEDNDKARELGKKCQKLKSDIEKARLAANVPDQAKIDDRNARAKKITQPLEAEVDRLKKTISFYEQEKERKRLAELKRLEEEAKEKAEKARLEQLRVDNIKATIAKIKSEGIPNLEKCNTLEQLTAFEAKLTGWQLKATFYMEFLPEAEAVKQELVDLIKQRRPLLEEIDKKNKEAEKLKGEQAENARKEVEAKQKQLAAEKEAAEQKRNAEELAKANAELEARNELTVLVASFGVKKVDDYIEGVLKKYGNAATAILDREKLIEDYKQSLLDMARAVTAIAGKPKNVRTDYLFSVIDENKIPREFLMVDEAKIKKAILENRPILEKDINAFKIEGLLIFPSKSTILK